MRSFLHSRWAQYEHIKLGETLRDSGDIIFLRPSTVTSSLSAVSHSDIIPFSNQPQWLRAFQQSATVMSFLSAASHGDFVPFSGQSQWRHPSYQLAFPFIRNAESCFKAREPNRKKRTEQFLLLNENWEWSNVWEISVFIASVVALAWWRLHFCSLETKKVKLILWTCLLPDAKLLSQ